MKFVEAAGVRVSSIGLGCWQFGSQRLGLRQGVRRHDRACQLVHSALDLGVNLIDTAEIYARASPRRSSAARSRVAATRRSSPPRSARVLPTADRVEEHGRLSSMRLGVETIDLYQVHWPNPAVPIAPTMEGMRRLQDDGIVRHVGVSNFSASGGPGGRARARAARCCRTRCSSASLQRKPDRRDVPYAQAHDRIVIAYSPLAQGVLGGRYDADEPAVGPGAARTTRSASPENLDRVAPLIETLRSRRRAHDATPAQVALAWLIRKPNVVAIPGASSVGPAAPQHRGRRPRPHRRRGRRAHGGERRVPAAARTRGRAGVARRAARTIVSAGRRSRRVPTGPPRSRAVLAGWTGTRTATDLAAPKRPSPSRPSASFAEVDELAER